MEGLPGAARPQVNHLRGEAGPPPTPFAIVRLAAAEPPHVDLRSLGPRLDGGPVPGVSDTGFIPSAKSGVDLAVGLPKSWRRLSERALRASANLGAFLGMRPPVDLDGAVCIEDRGEPTAFARTALGRRASFVQVTGSKTLPALRCTLDRVNVVTGTCLFGGRTLRVVDETGADFPITHPRAALPGRELVQIHANNDLSLYEWESTLRLCQSAADLVSTLSVDIPVVITVDVPRVQYYSYLLDAYKHGLVNAAMVIEWFDLVDIRHRKLSQTFADLIRDHLADRAPNVSLRQADPLGVLAPYLRAAVTADAQPSLDEMIGLLMSSSAADAAWPQVLAAIKPATVRQLVKASYVSTQVRAVTDDCLAGSTLTVQIENSTEWPILYDTRRVLAQLSPAQPRPSQAFLLGVYPLQQLMVTDEHGRLLDPYFHDPGRYAVDSEGTCVDLMAVVESLYAGASIGEDCT